MALRPDISLQTRVPDVGAAFNNALLNVQGIENISRGREEAPLRNRLLEAQAGQAEAGTQETQQLNRIRSLGIFANKVAPLVQSGDLPGIIAATENRIANELPAQGVPSNDSQELLTFLRDPSIPEAAKLQEVGRLAQGAISGAVQAGVFEAPAQADPFTLSQGQKRFDPTGKVIASGDPKVPQGVDGFTLDQVQSSKILPDGSTVQVFRDGSTRVTGPQGAVLAGQDRENAVTKAQEFGIDVQSRRAGGRTDATETGRRNSALVKRGIAAAESTAIIRRGLALLDKVKTGGVAAISLAVKARLGIEGANEGELSNSLGKAVLSQLRETFGAAFTENEGKRLERIEAGFGKSVATNRRLLGQALRIAENTAKRASKVASEGEAADIEDLLSFSLDIEGAEASQATGGELSNMTDEQLLQLRAQAGGQ